MGKKKDKHGRKHGAHDHDHGRGDRHGGDAGAGVAGLAAMAMAQVRHQLDTPAGRQMMAMGLRAAADALAPKPAAPLRPESAAPPPPPAPPEPPQDPTPPRSPDVPPDVARVIGSVAAGLEKWAAKLGVPKN